MQFLLPFIILFFSNFVFAATLNLHTPNVYNAQTALVTLEGKNITKAKLTLMSEKKLNINFEQAPFLSESYYALVPISYYLQPKKYKIIVSYFENEQKIFKSISLNVKNGPYKSETIKVKKSKVKPNKKQQKRTQKEYKEAIAIYKSKAAKLFWKDEFVYPMQSKITSAFGTKRVYNNLLKSYHSGTDFKAKVGTPIYSVNDGIVKMASKRYYAGNAVIVDHGHGIYTCYFHLSSFNVKVGQKIKKGERLGLSGATGRVTGPHLHFAARVHGFQVDPLQLLDVLNQLKNKPSLSVALNK